MKTLFVRIGQKAGPETFYRCGMAFARAWQQVEVDAATAKRLEAEQMLEVSEDQPEDYEVPADAEAQAAVDAEAEAKAAAAAKVAAKVAAAAQAKKK